MATEEQPRDERGRWSSGGAGAGLKLWAHAGQRRDELGQAREKTEQEHAGHEARIAEHARGFRDAVGEARGHLASLRGTAEQHLSEAEGRLSAAKEAVKADIATARREQKEYEAALDQHEVDHAAWQERAELHDEEHADEEDPPEFGEEEPELPDEPKSTTDRDEVEERHGVDGIREGIRGIKGDLRKLEKASAEFEQHVGKHDLANAGEKDVARMVARVDNSIADKADMGGTRGYAAQRDQHAIRDQEPKGWIEAQNWWIDNIAKFGREFDERHPAVDGVQQALARVVEHAEGHREARVDAARTGRKLGRVGRALALWASHG